MTPKGAMLQRISDMFWWCGNVPIGVYIYIYTYISIYIYIYMSNLAINLVLRPLTNAYLVVKVVIQGPI